jgi:hypothetical protein
MGDASLLSSVCSSMQEKPRTKKSQFIAGALLFILGYGASLFLPKHPYFKPSEIERIRQALNKKK